MSGEDELPLLRWRPFSLPMRQRFHAAHGATDSREGVVVELTDGDGRRGCGEASPVPSLGTGEVADVLSLLERHGASLAAPEAAVGLPAGPGVAALRCALDVAALDLAGQRRGLPLSAVLAEQPAPWVAVNAVIGGGPPFEVAQYGLEAMQRGYSVLKLKVGLVSVEEDERRVAMLREACPEATIRLDANCAWDERTAVEAIAAFYPHRIELLEQPVAAGDVEALARIREAAPLRIAADEAVDDPRTLDRLLELRAADVVVLKPMLLGGLRPALDVARRAYEAGVNAYVTTTFDSSIGTLAALHLAAALPQDAAHGLATGEHLGADVVADIVLPRAGRLAVPPGPGLGAVIDEAALDAVATAPWSAPSTEARP